VVSFTFRPLYRQGKRPWYPLDGRVGGPKSRSGRGGEQKKLINSRDTINNYYQLTNQLRGAVSFTFTKGYHWFLFWVRLIQSISSHPVCTASILLLLSHLRLGQRVKHIKSTIIFTAKLAKTSKSKVKGKVVPVLN
jgi:hypothetical protein